jgi:hypothetical protein
LRGNKYADVSSHCKSVVVSGTLTFVLIQAGRLNRRADKTKNKNLPYRTRNSEEMIEALRGNKYADVSSHCKRVVVSGTLTVALVRAGRLNRRAHKTKC